MKSLVAIFLTLVISVHCRNVGVYADIPKESFRTNGSIDTGSEGTVIVEQAPTEQETLSPGINPSPLSPWSAWMQLKAPPTAFLKPKNKAFPPPFLSQYNPQPIGSEATLQPSNVAPLAVAPWVLWTKLKTSATGLIPKPFVPLQRVMTKDAYAFASYPFPANQFGPEPMDPYLANLPQYKASEIETGHPWTKVPPNEITDAPSKLSQTLPNAENSFLPFPTSDLPHPATYMTLPSPQSPVQTLYADQNEVEVNKESVHTALASHIIPLAGELPLTFSLQPQLSPEQIVIKQIYPIPITASYPSSHSDKPSYFPTTINPFLQGKVAPAEVKPSSLQEFGIPLPQAIDIKQYKYPPLIEAEGLPMYDKIFAYAEFLEDVSRYTGLPVGKVAEGLEAMSPPEKSSFKYPYSMNPFLQEFTPINGNSPRMDTFPLTDYNTLYPYLSKTPGFTTINAVQSPSLDSANDNTPFQNTIKPNVSMPVAEEKLLVNWAKKIFQMQKNSTWAARNKTSMLEAAWVDWLKLHDSTDPILSAILHGMYSTNETTKVPISPSPTEDNVKELVEWLTDIDALPQTPLQLSQVVEWLVGLGAMTSEPEVSTLTSPQKALTQPFPIIKTPSGLYEIPLSNLQPNYFVGPAQSQALPYDFDVSLGRPIQASPDTAYLTEGAKLNMESYLTDSRSSTPFIDNSYQFSPMQPYLQPSQLPQDESLIYNVPYSNIPSPPSYLSKSVEETLSPENKAFIDFFLKLNQIGGPESFGYPPAETLPQEIPVYTDSSNVQSILIPPVNAPTFTPDLAEWLRKTIPNVLQETAPLPLPSSPSGLQEGPVGIKLTDLNPLQYSILLQKLFEECNKTKSLVQRSKSASKHGKGRKQPKKNGDGEEFKRALYPPSYSDFVPTTTEQPIQSKLLDVVPKEFWDMIPSVAPNTSIIDPGYWAAKKSMFISKLFDALARVTMNYTNSALTSTTESPKQKLQNKINTVILSDAVRSVKDKDEDSSETATDDESLINSEEPDNLPKEPENPLHKLFKFGVQKTILSDTSSTPGSITTTVAAPSTTTTSLPPKIPSLEDQKFLINKLKSVYDASKKDLKKSKKAKSKKIKKFRGSTTTTSPIDFEALAKALLVQPSK